ncbi:hypothetical protein Pmani_035395 [Petrolisthes manimaculis]|uniref:Uncharacterized protein n=1 Tax=Petrolisthes manimaculis TaxID=1843537 RepID=A0AAE1TNR6_9EUCA|nr:hypothetical protein Pmani_035395 [Petrolisthes manimaculis]
MSGLLSIGSRAASVRRHRRQQQQQQQYISSISARTSPTYHHHNNLTSLSLSARTSPTYHNNGLSLSAYSSPTRKYSRSAHTSPTRHSRSHSRSAQTSPTRRSLSTHTSPTHTHNSSTHAQNSSTHAHNTSTHAHNSSTHAHNSSTHAHTSYSKSAHTSPTHTSLAHLSPGETILPPTRSAPVSPGHLAPCFPSGCVQAPTIPTPTRPNNLSLLAPPESYLPQDVKSAPVTPLSGLRRRRSISPSPSSVTPKHHQRTPSYSGHDRSRTPSESPNKTPKLFDSSFGSSSPGSYSPNTRSSPTFKASPKHTRSASVSPRRSPAPISSVSPRSQVSFPNSPNRESPLPISPIYSGDSFDRPSTTPPPSPPPLRRSIKAYHTTSQHHREGNNTTTTNTSPTCAVTHDSPTYPGASVRGHLVRSTSIRGSPTRTGLGRGFPAHNPTLRGSPTHSSSVLGSPTYLTYPTTATTTTSVKDSPTHCFSFRDSPIYSDSFRDSPTPSTSIREYHTAASTTTTTPLTPAHSTTASYSTFDSLPWGLSQVHHQVSVDDRRQLFSAGKINVESGMSAYGSIAYQMRDANMDSNNTCEFVYKALKIISKTGVNYLHECPLEPNVPIYLLVGGCFGSLKMLWLICQQVRSRRYERIDDAFAEDSLDEIFTSTSYKATDVALTIFLIAWFGMGNYWVYRIYQPNYHAELYKPNDWCSKTVYLFAVAQLLFVYAILGVALVITICLACGQKCVTLFGESYK